MFCTRTPVVTWLHVLDPYVSMKILRTLGLCFCMTLALLSSAHAQSVTISRDTELRAEPTTSSIVVSTVKREESAVVTAKQGPWLRIRVDNREGWLLTTSVLYGPARDARIGIRGSTTHIILEDTSLVRSPRQIGEEQLRLLDEYARQYDEELARANAAE